MKGIDFDLVWDVIYKLLKVLYHALVAKVDGSFDSKVGLE